MSLRFLCRSAVFGLLLTAGCQGFLSRSDRARSSTAHAHKTAVESTRERLPTPEQATDRQRKKFRAQIAKAESLEAKREYDDAIDAYRKALLTIEDPQIVHRLALLCQQQQEDADADAYFSRSLALMPGNAELLTDVGYRAYLKGDFARARRHYQSAVVINPDSPRLLANYALVMQACDDDQRALELFQRAGCTQQEALENLAQLCRLSHDEEQADYYWALARETEDSDPIQPVVYTAATPTAPLVKPVRQTAVPVRKVITAAPPGQQN
jgi:Flp pilus assembly protein TadD